MRIERIKSIILIVLVFTSIVLSFTLWTGVKSYDSLPSWVLKSATTGQIITEPIVPPVVKNIAEEKLINALLQPDKMVEHGIGISKMYYLGSSTFASKSWEKVYTSIKDADNAKVTKIDLSEWVSVTKDDSYEFIFAGSYPVEVLIPNWHGNINSIKIERLMITTGDEPKIYMRSLNYKTLYRVDLQNITWPESGVKTFKSNADKGWYVYDGGNNNEEILTGVYLPSNFIASYGQDFPEIMISAEIQDQKKWLSVFFTNTSLAREITLSQNRYHYNLGTTSVLKIDYNKSPHIEYNYYSLSKHMDPVNYAKDFLVSSNFVNKYNYTNWPNFESDVKLVRAWSKSQKRNFIYNTYTTGLKYNIPVLNSVPSYTVESEGGIVSKMTRQVWQLGRKNYLPKIAIEASTAIEKLSTDKWKVATDANPDVVEVVNRFQDHLKKGYKISDVSLSYYVNYELTKQYLVAPHWVVTLTNGQGNSVRYMINAFTSFIPKNGGLEVTE